MSERYSRLTHTLVTRPKRVMIVYAGLIAATAGMLWTTPTGFIPQQDQGYFLTVIQLPSGASVERTDAVMRKVAQRILPLEGVKGAVMLAGFDGPSQTLAPNAAAAYIPLKDFKDRPGISRRPDHGRGAEGDRRHHRGAADDRAAARHPGHRRGRRLPHDGAGPRAATAIRRWARKPMR